VPDFTNSDAWLHAVVISVAVALTVGALIDAIGSRISRATPPS
jgi:hypothetical protein